MDLWICWQTIKVMAKNFVHAFISAYMAVEVKKSGQDQDRDLHQLKDERKHSATVKNDIEKPIKKSWEKKEKNMMIDTIVQRREREVYTMIELEEEKN